jgi:hypothetical protein
MSIFDWLKKLAEPSGASDTTKKTVAVSKFSDSMSRSGPSSQTSAVPKNSQMGDLADDAPPDMTAAEKQAMVVGGLDFFEAITAHQKWKTRLSNYVAATSAEKLDYRQICRDDQCVLGKWINGNGGHTYGHIPVFSQLKMTHAQFHLAAGLIVQMTDDGNRDQAKAALRQGDYSKHSVKVQGLISSLYVEVNQQERS